MARTITRTIDIASPLEQVFEFVADPGKLPLWAIGFCERIERDGDGWVVTTPTGQRIPMRSTVDGNLGVIDSTWELAPGVAGKAFSRVVPNGAGADYVFTMVQADGMPDDMFEAQAEELAREFTVLKARLESTCPL